MKKILILYSNTGAGHLRTAQAIKEEIESLNSKYTVLLFDGLENLRFGIKNDPSSAYALFSTKLQGFYNLAYGLTNNKKGISLMRFLTRKAAGRKLRQVLEKEKPDLIISTHGMLSKSVIKKPHHSPPFVTVITDLGKPHKIWFDEDSDKIITPTDSLTQKSESMNSGLKSKTVYIDYPVDSRFRKIKSVGKATGTILIIGGGTGSGNLEAQVKALLGNIEQKIIVICGRNKKLFDSLKKKYQEDSQIEIYGFADNLPELYARSDIILTKAGPGAIAEAAVLNKPVIITGWVGMQEKENINFVLENKLGAYEPDPKKLARTIEKIYKNYESFRKKRKLFGFGAKSVALYIHREYLS